MIKLTSLPLLRLQVEGVREELSRCQMALQHARDHFAISKKLRRAQLRHSEAAARAKALGVQGQASQQAAEEAGEEAKIADARLQRSVLGVALQNSIATHGPLHMCRIVDVTAATPPCTPCTVNRSEQWRDVCWICMQGCEGGHFSRGSPGATQLRNRAPCQERLGCPGGRTASSISSAHGCGVQAVTGPGVPAGSAAHMRKGGWGKWQGASRARAAYVVYAS